MSYSPLELADAFIKTGELSDALDALNQHLGETPDDEETLRLRIEVLMRLPGEHNLRAALADLDKLVTPTPDDHARRSVALERMGNIDGAITAMQQARSDSGNERLAERHLQLLAAQGKTVAALELVRTQPRSWRWLQWEGDLLVMEGDGEPATERYGTALDLLEERRHLMDERHAAAMRARLLLARAKAHQQLGNSEQAESDYAAAVEIVPDDPMIPFNQGLLASLRGDMDSAVKLCREAITDANDVLRAEMQKSLQGDERFRALSAALKPSFC